MGDDFTHTNANEIVNAITAIENDLASIGALETHLGSVNILLETEIDASAELLALMDDETGTGSLVFGTSPTIATPTLTLTNSTTPTPTVEGRMEWDSDDHEICVGDGAGTVCFSATASGANADTYESDGTNADIDPARDDDAARARFTETANGTVQLELPCAETASPGECFSDFEHNTNAPSNPASGSDRVYFDSDGKLSVVDSSGNVRMLRHHIQRFWGLDTDKAEVDGGTICFRTDFRAAFRVCADTGDNPEDSGIPINGPVWLDEAQCILGLVTGEGAGDQVDVGVRFSPAGGGASTDSTADITVDLNEGVGFMSNGSFSNEKMTGGEGILRLILRDFVDANSSVTDADISCSLAFYTRWSIGAIAERWSHGAIAINVVVPRGCS